MFISAVLLTVLKAASIYAGDQSLFKLITDTDLSKYLPSKNDDEKFRDRILHAEKDGKLSIIDSSEMIFNIDYDPNTFTDNLIKILSVFFKDVEKISLAIGEVVKVATSGIFEMHDVVHETSNNATVITIEFTPIKYDKVWNLYFMKIGKPYVNIKVSKDKLIIN